MTQLNDMGTLINYMTQLHDLDRHSNQMTQLFDNFRIDCRKIIKEPAKSFISDVKSA